MVIMNEDTVNLMGLTFFCNSMFEELYHMKKNKLISERLKEKCKIGIAEFNSLKWPRNKKPYPDIKTNLFNTNSNLNTFEQICEHYRKPAEQMIEELILNLECIISDKPINKKYQTAEKLRKFFDDFGDYSYYGFKDYLRAI